MRCKVGYWRTGLAVQVDEEAREWLQVQGRALCAQVTVDRRILLVGCSRGAALSRLSHTPASHACRDMHSQGEVLPPYLEFLAGPGFELPRFELHELEVDYDYAMDGLLTEPLGPDFTLPWPSRRHRDNRMSAEELRHQCYLRIKAHMLVGGHGMFDEVGVPKEVVRLMAPGGYPLALEKARKEVDVILARRQA